MGGFLYYFYRLMGCTIGMFWGGRRFARACSRRRSRPAGRGHKASGRECAIGSACFYMHGCTPKASWEAAGASTGASGGFGTGSTGSGELAGGSWGLLGASLRRFTTRYVALTTRRDATRRDATRRAMRATTRYDAFTTRPYMLNPSLRGVYDAIRRIYDATRRDAIRRIYDATRRDATRYDAFTTRRDATQRNATRRDEGRGPRRDTTRLRRGLTC